MDSKLFSLGELWQSLYCLSLGTYDNNKNERCSCEVIGSRFVSERLGAYDTKSKKASTRNRENAREDLHEPL